MLLERLKLSGTSFTELAEEKSCVFVSYQANSRETTIADVNNSIINLRKNITLLQMSRNTVGAHLNIGMC